MVWDCSGRKSVPKPDYRRNLHKIEQGFRRSYGLIRGGGRTPGSTGLAGKRGMEIEHGNREWKERLVGVTARRGGEYVL